MKHCKAVIVVLILVLTPFSALAKPVKIEYKYRAGEINRYKMVVNAGAISENASMPNLFNMVAAIRQKTLAVNPDGSARIKVSFESIKYGMAGNVQSMDASAFPEITVLTSKNGKSRILSDSNGKDSASGIPGIHGNPLGGGMFGGLSLPTKPVSVGQKWTQSLSEPFSGKVISKLVSANSRIGSYDAAKIAGSVAGKMDLSRLGLQIPGQTGDKPAPVSGNYALFISPKTGKMIRTEGTFTTSLSMPAPPPKGKDAGKSAKTDITFKMEMFLLK